MVKQYKAEIGGKELFVEIGRLAGQANGQVFVKYGETSVLATATMSKDEKSAGYFPLTVDYQEKFFAAGKIKGSRWVKRDGRPSDEAILTSRLIDRTLRPRFDQRIKNEIQVIVMTLSFDGQNDPDIPALFASSLALGISDIPFNGPIAGCRVGANDEKLIANPIYSERIASKFDMVISGTKDRINMLEGGAKIVDDKAILEAIEFGHEQLKQAIILQEQIIADIGKPKLDLNLKDTDPKLEKEVLDLLGDNLEKAIYGGTRKEMYGKIDEVKKNLLEQLNQAHKQDPELSSILQSAGSIFDTQIDEILHAKVLESGKRPDGRGLDELRPISAEVGILPRTHGTGLFNRGETQVLSILTLGSPSKEQWIETMETEEKKKFMHHYEFPPFSSGETGRTGTPNRREIGHGALAEKAITPVIPETETFPYTIRIVSESLSSNGSTSMASVCGSSLALMDGGVPIKDQVAGISTGLILSKDGKKFEILTDIQGPEDHHGDMDLKIAGTKDGITAIQMDVKIEGINMEILNKAFAQSKQARFKILDIMNAVIAKPRPELSSCAPRITTIQINPDKIRTVIGPQGKVINEIIAQTGVTIDIEDTGQVMITSDNEEAAQKAITWIKSLTKEAKVGEVSQGKVVKILDFGAFVELAPGLEGLVHISELSNKRVAKVTDIVKLGDMVTVKVKNIDDLGRVNLTMRLGSEPKEPVE